MIVLVDEDVSLYEGYVAELQRRGREVQTYWNADEACDALVGASARHIELVIVDWMLGCLEPDRWQRYGPGLTDVGVDLVVQLADRNPAVFPRRAVMWTASASLEARMPQIAALDHLGVPIWSKPRSTDCPEG